MRHTSEGPGAAGPGPAILEHMRVGVIFADAQGLVRYANKVACALLDMHCEELIERSVLCLRPVCLRNVIEGAIGTFRDDPHAPPITFHSSLCARGILLHCAPVCGVDDAYEGIVLNLTDITDHLRSLERHFESKQAEAIRTLTGGIAHGFNNLMAVVLGLASHLKARWAPDDPDRINLTAIENAAATAGRLAHELLAMVGAGPFFKRITGAADVIAMTKTQIEALLPGSVTADYRVPSDAWEVEVDRVQIGQVLVAVCRNAVEAMPSGGRLSITARNVTLPASLPNAHTAVGPGQYVCFSVEDTGCGMSPEVMERAFEPFFTTKAGGYGLSLAAARSIVRNHGGAMSVTASPGQGSLFEIWLPRAQQEPHPQPNGHSDGKRRRGVAVDDRQAGPA